MSGPALLLTIDVEPDWGVRGDGCVREALPRLLGALDRYEARATFFVVSDMLATCEDALRVIADRHEIASHGASHPRLTDLPDEDVDRELADSRRRLEGLGREVRGFRAPFLLTPGRWAERLRRAGYEYDSSEGRCRPSFRNVPPGRWRKRREGGVAFLPPTTLRGGFTPFSLTWLRLAAPLGEWLARPDARMFYMHLHELADPRHADVLPWPLRWLLRRNAGEPAWGMLERLLRRRGKDTMTCWEFLQTSEDGGAE